MNYASKYGICQENPSEQYPSCCTWTDEQT